MASIQYAEINRSYCDTSTVLAPICPPRKGTPDLPLNSM